MAGETDAEFASRLTIQTGRILNDMRESLLDSGVPQWQVKDRADAAAQEFLAAELAEHRPHDAVLSEEEGRTDQRRFDSDRVWIIDPLDGTREFSEPGRTDWAVHVALWSVDRFLAGAVSLPAMNAVFSTDPAPHMPAVERDRPRLITSRNRAPYSAHVVADALDCDAIRLGSAGAKAMAVVMGHADIYVHDGGMYQWDTAAPAAVALAAGFHATRIDGTPLVYNERDPWLPDFILCRPEYAAPVMEALWG